MPDFLNLFVSRIAIVCVRLFEENYVSSLLVKPLTGVLHIVARACVFYVHGERILWSYVNSAEGCGWVMSKFIGVWR